MYWHPLSDGRSTPAVAAASEGHLQRLFDQLGAHVVGQGQADYAAAGQVDDGGQVGPALPGAR